MRKRSKDDSAVSDANRRIDPNLISEALSGIMYDFDAQRGTTVRSKGLYEILGFHPSEAHMDVNWWNSRIHPDDRDRVKRAFDAAEQHCQIEYRIRHRDGHYVHIWDRAIILRNATGSIERIVGNNLDITRFKEIEAILEASYLAEREARETAERTAYHLARLHRITTGFSVSVTTEDVGRTILEELGSIFRADRTMLFVRSTDCAKLELVAARGCPEPLEETLFTLSEDSPFPFCECAYSSLGPIRSHRWTDMTQNQEYKNLMGNSWTGNLVSVPVAIGPRILGVIALEFRSADALSEDEYRSLFILALECAQALERARLYEAERNSREKAEAASRAKDEFFAVVSHELRSPLQAILGWIRVARTSRLDSATSARALEVMERNTRAQVQLVSDMLEASRIVTGKVSMAPESISIASILESSLDSVRPTAINKGVELSFESLGQPPVIWGDPNRLQQVFWNILSNGVKFTPKGGAVGVRIDSTDQEVRVTFKDTGEGISAEFLPHVFERFVQSDESKTRLHGGLGLGLAIARHIVELHGGKISAQSTGMGQGASFTVVLPVGAPSHRAQNVTQGIDSPRNPLRGGRILVVEDTPDTRELLHAVLESAGAEVLCVDSSPAALMVIEQFRPHVLLSDIGLPGDDGCFLVQNVRQRWSSEQLPAIALTALASNGDRARCLEAGFQAHIAKPVDPDELIKHVSRAMSSMKGFRPVDPCVASKLVDRSLSAVIN